MSWLYKLALLLLQSSDLYSISPLSSQPAVMASTGNVEKVKTGNLPKVKTGDVQKANKKGQRYVPKTRSSNAPRSTFAVPTAPESPTSASTTRKYYYPGRRPGLNRWSHSDQNKGTNITLILETCPPAYYRDPYFLNESVPPPPHGQFSHFHQQYGCAHHYHNPRHSQAHLKAIVSDEYHVGNGHPCSDYNHGWCKWGNTCYKRHAPDDNSEQDKLKRNVCAHFLLKKCTKSNCAYLHDDSQLPHGWWCTETTVKAAQAIFDKSQLGAEGLAKKLRDRFNSLQMGNNVFAPEGCKCLQPEKGCPPLKSPQLLLLGV